MPKDGTTATLTAAAIRERLGFSTIAMPGDEPIGARDVVQIRATGLTRMEICGLHPPTHYDYHNAAQVAEIAAACRDQGVDIVAVHGPGVPYDSPYEAVRRGAVAEAVASARVAEEMGASMFVAGRVAPGPSRPGPLSPTSRAARGSASAATSTSRKPSKPPGCRSRA